MLTTGKPRSRGPGVVYSEVVEPPIASLARHVRSPSSVCVCHSGQIELAPLAYASQFLPLP